MIWRGVRPADALGEPVPVGLLGDGAQSREVASFLPAGSVAFRAVAARYLAPGLVDLAAPSDAERSTPVVAAVGPPGLRRELLHAWPGSRYARVTAPGALIADDVELGSGSIVAPGAVVSVGATIGAHALVNIGATLSHDVVVGEFAVLAPGAHVAGATRIGAGAWIGIGATLVEGISVADGVVIGAGAVVLHDVGTENAVLVGNPARILRVEPGWLTTLPKRRARATT